MRSHQTLAASLTPDVYTRLHTTLSRHISHYAFTRDVYPDFTPAGTLDIRTRLHIRQLHTRLHARRLHQSAHQTPHQIFLHTSLTTDLHTRLHTRLQARGYHGYSNTSLHAPNIHAGSHTQRSRRHGTADVHGSKWSHQHIRTSRVHIIRSHQTFAPHLAP